MHPGAPKKKKTGITSFSVDVLGLTVPDGSYCQLILIILHASYDAVNGNRNIP